MTINTTLDISDDLIDEAFYSLEDYEDANGTKEVMEAGDNMMAAVDRIVSYGNESYTSLFNMCEEAERAIEEGADFSIIKAYFDQIYEALAEKVGYFDEE